MRDTLVSAVFDTQTEAQQAMTKLRECGVEDSAISIIAQHDGKTTTTAVDSDDNKTEGFIGKTAAGAGIGTLLGIAALAIPGVGPLAAAGAIAASAVPGAALTGAAIGAATGGVTALLKDHGVDEADASYYEEHIGNGGVFMSVDTAGTSMDKNTIRDIMFNAGGHNSTQARSTMTAA